MGKLAKKLKKRKIFTFQRKKNSSEDIAYYFLAVIGFVIVALVVVGILGFFKII